MLIPQFSLRLLLGVTSACAVIFTIVGLAVRGHAWAAGVSIGFAACAVAMAVYALLFAGVWVFSVAAEAWRRRRRAVRSPFQSPPAASDETPASPFLLE